MPGQDLAGAPRPGDRHRDRSVPRCVQSLSLSRVSQGSQVTGTVTEAQRTIDGGC